VVDDDGNPVLSEEALVEFNVAGNGKILGVDNGAADNVQDFRSASIRTSRGRCLMIIQSLKKPGSVRVTASSGTIRSEPARVKIR
jgi:hypothetical protein